MKVAQFAVLAMLVFLPGCTNLFGTRGATQDPGRLAAEAYAVGDFSTAITLWTPLANRGNQAAQFSLVSCWKRVRGFPRDYAGEGRWYELAAEQGYAKAQNNLGNLYQEGVRAPPGYNLAARSYVLAARQGEASAQFSLGFLYVNDPTVHVRFGYPKGGLCGDVWRGP